MLATLKKHGMVALSGALALWLVFIASTAPFMDEEWGATGAEQAALSSLHALGGILIVAGLIGRARGMRGWRYALGLGAVIGGLISWWAVVPAIFAAAILVWLFAPRRLRRTPAQPA